MTALTARSTGGSAETRVLMVGTPALVAATIGAALLLRRIASPLPALIALSVFYWVGCWSLARFGAPGPRLSALYQAPWNRRPLELVLTWAPVVATFVWVFLKFLPGLSAMVLAAVLVFAAINGFTEELLWRGAFAASFPGRAVLGYLLPTAWFTAWHFALFLLPGIHWVHRGPVGLIGGAAAAGLAWGWVVFRTRDLRSVTLAHVLTNVFTFSGLAVSNGWP